MTNTNKLKGAIVSAGYTQAEVADKLGISSNSLSNKINNNSRFLVDEMFILIRLLGIKDYENIFFCQESTPAGN